MRSTRHEHLTRGVASAAGGRSERQASRRASRGHARPGALIGPVFNVVPAMGAVPAIKAYIVVVLGGLGSIPGAIVGALILGQVEVFATILIPDTNRALAYKDAYGLVVLILVLLVRPQGLFGKPERRA